MCIWSIYFGLPALSQFDSLNPVFILKGSAFTSTLRGIFSIACFEVPFWTRYPSSTRHALPQMCGPHSASALCAGKVGKGPRWLLTFCLAPKEVINSQRDRDHAPITKGNQVRTRETMFYLGICKTFSLITNLLRVGCHQDTQGWVVSNIHILVDPVQLF